MDEFLKMQQELKALGVKYEYLNSVVNIQSKQIDLLMERFGVLHDIIKVQNETIMKLAAEEAED